MKKFVLSCAIALSTLFSANAWCTVHAKVYTIDQDGDPVIIYAHATAWTCAAAAQMAEDAALGYARTHDIG